MRVCVHVCVLCMVCVCVCVCNRENLNQKCTYKCLQVQTTSSCYVLCLGRPVNVLSPKLLVSLLGTDQCSPVIIIAHMETLHSVMGHFNVKYFVRISHQFFLIYINLTMCVGLTRTLFLLISIGTGTKCTLAFEL